MASYHPYDRDHSRRVLAGDDLDDWDPRYFDSHGNFRDSSTQIVPRAREDSGLSAEGVRRDYLVTTERDVRRARSAEPGYVQQDYEYHRSYGHPHPEPSRHDRQYEEHRVRRTDRYYEDEVRSQVRTEVRTERTERRQKHASGLTTQDKIIAAVAGAALLAGGKEMYDRHEAKEDGTPVHRNPLASAALAGFGALAAYQGAEFYSDRQAKKDRRAKHILHRGQTNEYDYSSSSDDDDDDHHHHHHYQPGYGSRENKGRKNFLESALAATGLGAAVKSLAGAGGDDRRSDVRSRGGSPTPSRASSARDGRGHSKVQQAAIASLLAGATEAFCVAKEPGGWRGEKTKRILTAAAGAATVDAAHGAEHGKMGLAESVIGGLVGNRLINGSRNDIEEDRMTGRSRSRSRARSRAGGRGGAGGGSAVSSLAALATAGLGALGAKKALDRSRSRSRGRYDSRSPSSGSRRQERSRSRSVVDKARDGLARLGLGGQGSVAAGEHERRQRRDRQGSFDAGSQASRRSQRRLDGYDEYGHGHGEHGSRERHGGRRSGYESDSSLGDSDDDKGKRGERSGKQDLEGRS